MKSIWTLLFCFLPAILIAQEFELTSVNLTVQDGLVGDNVYCAMQDNKGYIWFGTETGVSRYNGREFENFYMSDGLGDNEIFRIDQDSQGRIWFSAFNGKLSYFKDGTFYNESNSEILKKVSFEKHYVDIFEDSRQNIWLASIWKIAMIGANGEVKNHEDFGLGKEEYIGSFSEEEGEVWGRSSRFDKKFHLSHALSKQAKRLPDVIEGDLKKVIPDQEVFLSTSNNVFVHKYLNAYVGDPVIKVSFVSKLNDYGDGNLWACTFDGALKINKKTGTSMRYFKGLQIAHVLKDLENGYWFTTLGSGVFYVPNLDNQSISTIDNMAVGNTTVVFNDDDKVWFGANKAKFGSISDDALEITSFYMSKGRSRAKSIVKGKNPGDLLIVLEEALILKKSDGTFGRIDGSIKNFQKWTDQVYVAGVTWGLLFIDVDMLYGKFHFVPGTRSPKGNWGFFRKPFTMKHLYMSPVIEIEPYGPGLLVASSRGLYYVNEDLQEIKMNDHPVMNSVINDIHVLNDSTYILASNGFGSFLFSGEKISQFSTDQGLSSDIHRKVFPENDSTFWLATNAGVNKVMLNQGELAVKHVGTTDGLMSEDVNDVTIWDDKLVAATSKGISQINISTLEADQQPPLINMKQMTIDGMLWEDDLEIAPGPKSIAIHYDGLHFRSQESLSYQYRLLGYDDRWKVTTRNMMEFSGLSSGNYTFEVKAINAYGVESQVVEKRFMIATPFWATWWFIGLVAVLVLSICYFLVWQVIRRNRLKEQKKYELQLKIAEAERKALQSQLNPHFIFNSLNSIQNMVLDNNIDEVYQYLAKFGKLIRRVLEFSDISLISLADELETLRLYMELENLRLNDKFDFTISLSDHTDLTTEIPSMILQPHVENAIWHGITPLKGQRRGKITVLVSETEGGLRLEVSDNGVGRQPKTGESKSFGTRIVNELVRKYEGDRRGLLEIIDLYNGTEPAGTKVVIQFLPEMSL